MTCSTSIFFILSVETVFFHDLLHVKWLMSMTFADIHVWVFVHVCVQSAVSVRAVCTGVCA